MNPTGKGSFFFLFMNKLKKTDHNAIVHKNNGGKTKMKQTEKLLIVAIVVMAITMIVGFLPIHGEEEIYDTVVRLHVIANSDTEEDQSLKMAVRDSILEVVTPAVQNCDSQAEAIAEIGRVKESALSAARDIIKDSGYDYDVDIEIGREEYPTRDYGNFVFPSGEYISVRVIIGEGEGQNFWCCLYPPLCMSAASEVSGEYVDDAFIQAGLTGEQYKIITENDSVKYRVRFKILEAIEEIFD